MSPSYDEETKCGKVFMQREVGSLVSPRVIPDASPRCPLITSSEAFMTHPICLMCDVCGIDTMMAVPGWAGGFLCPEVVLATAVLAAPQVALWKGHHSQSSLV